MGDLNDVLREFTSDLERAEHLLNLIKSFRDFGSSSPPSDPAAEAFSWPEAIALLELASKVRTDLPLLSGSLALYLCGRFEFFVRQVVEAMADTIAAGVAAYENLPEALRIQLRSRTLEVAQSPAKYGFSSAQSDAFLSELVANLDVSHQPPLGALSISSQVLTITESNMHAKALAEILKRVGLTDYWKEVGKQASMKLLLDKLTEAECTIEAQARLNGLMDERNQIAHPTGSTSFPDPDQVLKSADFLRHIARVTVDLALVYLATLRAQSRP